MKYFPAISYFVGVLTLTLMCILDAIHAKEDEEDLDVW